MRAQTRRQMPEDMARTAVMLNVVASSGHRPSAAVAIISAVAVGRGFFMICRRLTVRMQILTCRCRMSMRQRTVYQLPAKTRREDGSQHDSQQPTGKESA